MARPTSNWRYPNRKPKANTLLIADKARWMDDGFSPASPRWLANDWMSLSLTDRSGFRPLVGRILVCSDRRQAQVAAGVGY
jgi:hypothetical protein